MSGGILLSGAILDITGGTFKGALYAIGDCDCLTRTPFGNLDQLQFPESLE